MIGDRGTPAGGNRVANSLPINMTAQCDLRNWRIASIADSVSFHGRPSERTLSTNPRSFTAPRTHFYLPFSRPLSMLSLTSSNSFVVKGPLTRAVQSAARSTGQGDNGAWIRMGFTLTP